MSRKYQEELDYISYQDIWDLKCKDNLTNDKKNKIISEKPKKVTHIGEKLFRYMWQLESKRKIEE